MAESADELFRRVFERASRVKDPSGRAMDALDADTQAVIFEFFDPAIEMHEDPRFPEAGVHAGKEAVTEYMRRFTDSFDTFVWEIDDLIGLSDDRVLALLRFKCRGKGSGVEIEEQPGWIFTAADGKTIRIDAFLSRADAFAFAGIEP
jgi:ketosteroid isomerase-like protein